MKRLFCLLIALALTLACAALAEAAPQMAPPRPLETPLVAAAPETTAMPKATAMPRAAAMPETTLHGRAESRDHAGNDAHGRAGSHGNAGNVRCAGGHARAGRRLFPPSGADAHRAAQPTRDPGRLTGVKIGIDPRPSGAGKQRAGGRRPRKLRDEGQGLLRHFRPLHRRAGIRSEPRYLPATARPLWKRWAAKCT